MSDLQVGKEVIKDVIHCTTNLDCKWGAWVFPKTFIAIPEIGDYIMTQERCLKVVSRCFKETGIEIEVTGPSSHS